MSETTKIREGEELNTENLAAFLEKELPDSRGEISVAQFPAGSSNLTYCVKIGDEEFVLRRPPFGNRVKTAHDMRREFDILSKLSKVYSPAPKPLLFCADERVIGSEFYLMERRRGLIIRGKSPLSAPSAVAGGFLSEPPAVAGGLTLKNSPTLRKKVCESFIENLVELHKTGYKNIGIEGKPEGYARRQVEGWTQRYFNSKTDEHSELEFAIKYLNNKIPEDTIPALVHNDYKFDNIILDPEDLTKIVAVLDWEMATVGCPLMDFGTTLGYWMSRDAGDEMLSMPFNPRVLMENISRTELAEMYSQKSGRDLSNILYYYIFGTFKIAVIAQQIYFRFAKGFTSDKRFARFNFFVERLGKLAANAIQRQSLDERQ